MAASVTSETGPVRIWMRLVVVATALLLAGVVWVAAVSIGGIGSYPACPADVAGYSGSCAVGNNLYQYEDGRACGKGSLLNGEEHWLDGGFCL